MRFLVTGGAGFIGSNIVNRLVKEGHQAVVLDDMSLGKESNILKNAEVLKGTVLNAQLVEDLSNGTDGIFHEAARSSAPMFSPDPRNGVDVNVMGFLNVLESARKHDIPIVYASTSSLYSKCKPPHEEGMLVIPGSFYEYSMYAREQAASLYATLYGLNVVGLRYFSVYGPNEAHKGKYANIISQFVWEMLNGKPPVIYGDGTQTRDFIHVDDVVEANLLAMKSSLKGEVINVGTGVSTSFNEVIALLNEELGTRIKPTYIQNPIKNYVWYTQADTKKAKSLLSFQAKISLRDGIRKLIEYYRPSRRT